jgi:hypothetical protein
MINNKKMATITCLLIQLLVVGCKSQDSKQPPGNQPISDNPSTVEEPSPNQSSSNDINIKDIANKFTVKITMKVGDTEINGNGIIFNIEKNNYYVLTTNHIFSSRISKQKIENPVEDDLKNINNKEKLEITTLDGESHTININTIVPLPNNLDLAYFKFSSNNKYNKASFANKYNTGDTVYIYGYKKCQDINANNLEFNSGNIENPPEKISGGYDLYYTNRAIETMSGSPIINTRGEVIAIHGKSRYDKGKYSKNFLKTCDELGFYFRENYGIPTHNFMDIHKIINQ